MGYIRITLIIFIFVIFVNHKCEAGKRYKIVILPFKDNTHMDLAETIPDILRSLVTQTGYFEAVERDKIYEMVTTVIPGDAIKIDNITQKDGAWTAEQVDLFSRLDTKRVQKFGKKLRADYALKGSVSQIGNSLRIDAEMIGVKTKKTLGFATVEGGPEELSSNILKELSDKITIFCRGLNAYDDALKIIGLYNQGQYTFDVSEKKLKEILSITEDAVGIRAALMVLYLSTIHNTEDAILEDKVIEEGESILNHLDQNFEEKALEVFLTSGFDPFDEIAKIYTKRGDNDKAIETYQKAISIYPMNIAGHYKELGLLYLKDGIEDKAVQAFEKSLEKNKGNYEVNFILASIFEKRNNPDKVRKHLEECIRYARNVEDIKTAKEKIDKLTH
ncbi:MAG: O-linked GlcNAc transferase [Candidatus Scalindua rubra]|uniref:O-linked GlcNAc transferase n=1 Tax=Candidatus Scalindua rubra TaxID=1872076 RepID=A0A1E3X3B4_9BACT|nr:MAG: O-linked GlcNAc transferase [Candidatus Scalindua rubra]